MLNFGFASIFSFSLRTSIWFNPIQKSHSMQSPKFTDLVSIIDMAFQCAQVYPLRFCVHFYFYLCVQIHKEVIFLGDFKSETDQWIVSVCLTEFTLPFTSILNGHKENIVYLFVLYVRYTTECVRCTLYTCLWIITSYLAAIQR